MRIIKRIKIREMFSFLLLIKKYVTICWSFLLLSNKYQQSYYQMQAIFCFSYLDSILQSFHIIPIILVINKSLNKA